MLSVKGGISQFAPAGIFLMTDEGFAACLSGLFLPIRHKNLLQQNNPEAGREVRHWGF